MKLCQELENPITRCSLCYLNSCQFLGDFWFKTKNLLVRN